MSKKGIAYLAGLGLLLALLVPFAHADDDDNENESGISIEGAFFYHNKYIDEGMNEIPGSGIFTPEIVVNFDGFEIGEMELPGFYGGSWWAIGEGEDFTESNIFIGKVFEWGDYSLDFRYIWLHTSEEEEEEEVEEAEEEEAKKDHEIEAVFSCECLPWDIEPEIGYVYSTQQNGGAFEIELGKEIETEFFSVEPYVEAMVDLGYVTDEYDGLNHIVVGFEVSIPLNDNLSIEMYAAHSFAEENIRREGGEDQTWGGIGMEFEM